MGGNVVKLYEQGREEYPRAGIVRGNLLMALWIASGTAAFWFFSPVAAWLFLAVALGMVGLVLRKLVCTRCYYYGRWCSMGWGKLAALFFKQGNIEHFRDGVGQKLAPVTYGLLSLLPLIAIVVSIVQQFTTAKLAVALVLLAVSAYSGAVSRKRTCAECKMRLVCKGAAAK